MKNRNNSVVVISTFEFWNTHFKNKYDSIKENFKLHGLYSIIGDCINYEDKPGSASIVRYNNLYREWNFLKREGLVCGETVFCSNDAPKTVQNYCLKLGREIEKRVDWFLDKIKKEDDINR